MHASFEALNPGYVRRRCISHKSWRTSDAVIRADCLSYKAICSYLNDGITWTRLRQIATVPKDLGGLQLFTDGGPRCKQVFGNRPRTIIDGRPLTDLQFLKFLGKNELTLHKLATHDLTQRALGTETTEALLHLGDVKQRIRRRILQELLERSMFLHWFVANHPRVANVISCDDLMNQAVQHLLDLEISQQVKQ